MSFHLGLKPDYANDQDERPIHRGGFGQGSSGLQPEPQEQSEPVPAHRRTAGGQLVGQFILRRSPCRVMR